MLIGESKFFRVFPTKPADVSSYSSYYDLYRNGEFLLKGDTENTGAEIKVELQTAGFKEGNYEIRVFISDPVDGFTEAYRKGFLLEK